jgi:hypothetical protein
VPLSQTEAELLFEVISQRYERGSTVVTSNLPFDVEMNGDSYWLNQSKRRSRRTNSDTPADNPTQA